MDCTPTAGNTWTGRLKGPAHVITTGNTWTGRLDREGGYTPITGNTWTERLGRGLHPHSRSRFYESSQQRYANVATVTWLARHFETVKFPITSSPRARPSNWANAELYRYKIVAVSLHKTHICVVKSLVKIAAVSWHSLRRFIKPAPGNTRSRFYESSQQRYANVATVIWLARHFETVKFPITSSPRARPSNWANAELYRYKIVAVSLHKTHICVVKSLVKIAAVSWHSLRRFIKPAPGAGIMKPCALLTLDFPTSAYNKCMR